jgi:hypothetical protein
MTDTNQPKAIRSRVRRDAKYFRVLITLMVVGLSTAIFLFFQSKHSEILSVFESFPQDDSVNRSSSKPSSIGTTGSSLPSPPPSSSQHTEEQGKGSTAASGESSPIAKVSVEPSEDAKTLPSLNNLPLPNSPASLAEELDQFFLHLDKQPYMAEFHLPEQSKKHFTKILQKLLNQPPAITRETDDYFTLLKNTAHFFRIIGKGNTLALKGILDRERDSLERILGIFYKLTDHPDVLKQRFSLSVAQEPLYEYACFFLNTIGGRLYLFRRDVKSRIVVSYYAIRIIDHANHKGYNRLGIDLRPFIDALIDEMEHSGGKLSFKDSYLDTLYDLKETYGNRG